MQASLVEPTAPIFASTYEYPWRVLRVETGRELDADKHLRLRGIETFLPTFTVTRRIAHNYFKPETVTRSLFPGYVMFAALPSRTNLAVTSPHVYEVLRFGREDAQVSESEMQRLSALTQEQAEPWERLETGQRIRVISGPLSGTEGRVLSRKGHLQIVVEIQMLARWIKVAVDGFSVEKA